MLLNELSLHGQFSSTHSFWESLERVMILRNIAGSYGHLIEINNSIFDAQVTSSSKMCEAVHTSVSKDKIRSVMNWLTKQGKLWINQQMHSDEDYLSFNEEVITGTSLGEAAFRIFEGKGAAVLSFFPSDWEAPLIKVDYYYSGDKKEKSCDVRNYWEEENFSEYLESIKTPIHSWNKLKNRMHEECKNITFSEDAFEPLFPRPFVAGAADRIVFLLKTLDHLKQCYDRNGKRTAEGHEIYQNFFTGKKGSRGRGALFTDSSDDEKRTFKSVLTFPNPSHPLEELFCPMHGKTQTPQFRVHFSWPMQADEPFYVVYVGPKRTLKS